MRRLLLVLLVFVGAPGCLVVTVNPVHTREAVVWEPGLVGEWQNVEDNSSIRVERGEWQSYDIEYAHPIEKGRLTGHLTTIGKDLYLDVMPARGQDHGSFLLPLHVVLRIELHQDRLELTALSYDWFFDRLRKKVAIPGLSVVMDEKENALVVSPTPALRTWLGRQPAAAGSFGPGAVFVRKKAG